METVKENNKNVPLSSVKNETKYSIVSMWPITMNVTGEYSGNFSIKFRVLGGYDVYESSDLLLKVRKNVLFKGVEIAKFPWFAYVIIKGYFGKFKTDHGIYSIAKSGKNKLLLTRDQETIGSIDYSSSSREIIINDDGSMPFPYQLTMACSLYNLIYNNSD